VHETFKPPLEPADNNSSRHLYSPFQRIGDMIGFGASPEGGIFSRCQVCIRSITMTVGNRLSLAAYEIIGPAVTAVI